MRSRSDDRLTVACVWVKGHVRYSAEYVSNLHRMVSAHLRRPHQFVCLTDGPGMLKDVYTIRVEPLPDLAWWTKLRLFDPERRWRGRVLYLDLDTLVVGALEPFVDFPAPFALCPHAGSFEGRGARKVVKRFNSSVMVWDAGVNSSLYTGWTTSVAERLHGDQDWIGEQWPEAATFPPEWTPRLSEVAGPPFPAGAKVILAKTPKNHEAAQRWPWFDQLWRGRDVAVV